MLNVQQAYTITLCTHINAILARVSKLETDIQLLTKKVTMEQDTVQIDAPDFDPDIDGPETQQAHNKAIVSVHDLFNSPEPDQIDASNTQEESIDQDQHSTTHTYPEYTHRLHNFFPQIQNQLPQVSSTGQQQSYLIHQENFDKSLQLEEDWENGQFADADTNLISTHNTHSESQRIQREY